MAGQFNHTANVHSLGISSVAEQDEAAEDNRSDTSSEITEIDTEEFPAYFNERYGRLFHSHGRSPYPLPVDADEQHRLNRQHALIKSHLGEGYIGPVQEVLRVLPGEQKCVVDLGTGTGRWVMEMAFMFPHVKFFGIDIVPIQTRHPHDNVIFEMQDIMEDFRYSSGSIDLVHARDISQAVGVRYPHLLDEVTRILRCNGLFISCEWGPVPMMQNRTPLDASAVFVSGFFSIVDHALRNHGIQSAAMDIPRFLQDSREFRDIHVQCYMIPIGDWDPAFVVQGRHLRRMLRVYAQSMKLWIVDRGYISEQRAQLLLHGVLHEIDTVPNMAMPLYTVHARRI